jgi:hypothetical protein
MNSTKRRHNKNNEMNFYGLGWFNLFWTNSQQILNEI